MLQPAAERSADNDRTSPPASQVALRVTDAAKAFGATQALRSASIEVRTGEIHAIVGENGAGKSTLIRILTGVERPDSGTITFEGQAVEVRSPQHAQAMGISTV